MKFACLQSPHKLQSRDPRRGRTRRNLVAGLLAALIFLVRAPAAFAATAIWDGGGEDDNWSTAANWAGDTLPQNGDNLLFTGNIRTNPVCDQRFGDMTLGSVTFDTPGFNVTGRWYVVTVTQGIYNVSSGPIEWAVPLLMGSDAEISTTSSAATTRIYDEIRLPRDSVLTIRGSGTWLMNGILWELSLMQNVSGTSALTIESGTTRWHCGLYTGMSTVKDGATLSFPTNAINASFGPVNLETGSRMDGTATIFGPLSIAGTVAPGPLYSMVVRGDVTLKPGGSVELACSQAGAQDYAAMIRLISNSSDQESSTNRLTVEANPADGVFTIKPAFDDTVDRTQAHNFAAFGYYMPAISGYDVGDVVVDGSSVTNSRDKTETWLDETTSAKFLGMTYIPAPTHTISCTLGTGATISPDISGAAAVITEGDDATYTFGISGSYPGKYISAVTIDGVAQTPVPASCTFTNVTTSHTIMVTTTDYIYTISADWGPNGSITPPYDTSVAYGGSQVYTITPDAGYHIANVLVDDVSSQTAITSGSYTFSNVVSSHTILASFAADTASNTGFLTPLLPADPRSFRVGQTIPVKYKPDNLSGAGAAPQTAPVPGTKSKPAIPTYTLTISGPCRFAAGPYKLTYDRKNACYLYNLSTKCWKPGTYTLTVKWSTGRTESVMVTITR